MRDRAEALAARRQAKAIRALVRDMFDASMDLRIRDEGWVHADSFDAGVIAVAKWMLDRADKIEAGDA